jgi:hypothetical protein
MTKHVRRFAGVIGLVLMAASLSACVVEGGHHGGGWCYWHPGACR